MLRTFASFLLFPILGLLSGCTYTFYAAACDYPQTAAIKRMAVLPDTLQETSGLAWNDSLFISFNDSGGAPELISFSADGKIAKHMPAQAARNMDWEAMAFDGRHYYIGDIGNNFGTRDTLQIYLVDAQKLDSQAAESIDGIISFSFDEETSKTESGWYSHDSEAMFYYRDSLYIFAKDWVHFETRVYILPAKPGHYQLKARSTYKVNALITGADIDSDRNEVILVGYTRFYPLTICYSFENDPALISCGGKARRYLRYAGTQMEGVCYDPAGRIFMSTEKRLYKPAIYRAY